jgi:hypothetical protein
VLTRPNLAVAIVPLLLSFRDWRSVIRFSFAAVPGLAILAALNAVRYGSPLASGYGSTGGLFAAANVVPNLGRYAGWIVETETPVLTLALLAPAVVGRPQRRVTIAALVSCALVFATYAFYTVFDDWWYLRFLLPILPVLVVAAVAVVLRAVPDRGRAAAAAVLAAALGAWCVRVATARHVFDLQRLEARFVRTGEYAARELPSDAVVLAVQQSGSVRFYAGPPTLAWDAVPAGTLDALVAHLRSSGHRVFAVLEDAEAQPFRDHFAGQQCGALSERPIAEVASAVRVRIYRLSCLPKP